MGEHLHMMLDSCGHKEAHALPLSDAEDEAISCRMKTMFSAVRKGERKGLPYFSGQIPCGVFVDKKHLRQAGV